MVVPFYNVGKFVTWSGSRSKVTLIIIHHFGTVLERYDPVNNEAEDDIPDDIVVAVVGKVGLFHEPVTKERYLLGQNTTCELSG